MRLGSQEQRRGGGFTLVELLIVITIIAVLAMLTTVMVGVARKNAAKAAAASDISAFKSALALYRDDEGIFPGHSKKWDGTDEHFNAFPELFDAVLGEPRSKGGKGGRNAPYWEEYKLDLVCVMEDENNPEEGLIEATRAQIRDLDSRKFYLDPFGNPYVYRENEQKKSEEWMWRTSTYDLWSCGPNGKNESMWADDEDMREESDDITSWN